MAGKSYLNCFVLSVLLLIQVVHAHTPSRNGTLTIVGADPTILLDICEGDCDSDADCHAGLKCFQRDGNQVVPGCTGDRRRYRGWDFCYAPPTKAPTRTPTKVPTKAPITPTKVPTKAPVVPTKVPTKAPTNAPSNVPTKAPIVPTKVPTVPTKAPIVPTKVPTKAPTSAPTKVPTKAPIIPTKVPTQAPIIPTKVPTKAPIAPTRVPTKAPITPTRVPTSAPVPGILQLSNVFPLARCQGDCDRDSDCQPGLRCFQRNRFAPIPGCTGDKRSFRGYDFCYKP